MTRAEKRRENVNNYWSDQVRVAITGKDRARATANFAIALIKAKYPTRDAQDPVYERLVEHINSFVEKEQL